MEHSSHTTDRRARARLYILIGSIALIGALAAILVFKVPISTVGYAALFIVMMASHLFMHGSHGAHGGGPPRDSRSPADGPTSGAQPNQEQPGPRSGGCH